MSGTILRYRQIRVADNQADQASPAQVLNALASSVTQEDLQYYYLSRLNQVIFGGAYTSHHWYEDFLSEGILSLADLTTETEDLQTQLNNIYSYTGTPAGYTNISPLLTNTGNYFPFSFLPGGAGDTVVSALNVLNQQIGDMTFTGPYLASGETVTAALQALSNAITTANFVRYVERLASPIPANTSHVLPAGATYTPDPSSNGRGLWVWWRGLFRDPGSVTNGDHYQETDSTHITPFSRIFAGDHIDYILA